MLWDLIIKEGCNRVFKIDLNRLCNWLCSSSHHFWVHLGKVLKAQQQIRNWNVSIHASAIFLFGWGGIWRIDYTLLCEPGRRGSFNITWHDICRTDAIGTCHYAPWHQWHTCSVTPLAHATMLRDTCQKPVTCQWTASRVTLSRCVSHLR